MKRIAIALPVDLVRWLRVKAAEDDRSVSGWLAELHQRMRLHEDHYEVAMRSHLEMRPRKLDWPGGRRPTREELHDRPGRGWQIDENPDAARVVDAGRGHRYRRLA